ncbi:MAG: class I SAM-dependent rRNA methyltransferase [Rubricoccaceae bacterium]
MPTLPQITLKPGKERALRAGYPWAFANQLARVEGAPACGDVVLVRAADGALLGQALYHNASLIAARLLTPDPEQPIDEAFFAARLDAALALRRAWLGPRRHGRLVFGEADGLPGTVIDRYDDVLTFSTLSFGMEQRRELLLDLLTARLARDGVAVRAVVERNEAALRGKDGLEPRTGLLRGQLDGPVEIAEHGVTFAVDVLAGPKTGFFLDQHLNRGLVAPLARGRRVLDVFCADGGFGLAAAAAGAAHVHFLDVSAPALERVADNAARNGLAGRTTTEAADALERLGQMADAGTSDFDLVVLDPPGFAKSRQQLEAATRAYQRINISALRLLPPGGILVTASCSQAMDEAAFLKTVHYSARRAGCRLLRLARGTQPPDHPVLEAMPETHYLKLFVFQKIAA